MIERDRPDVQPAFALWQKKEAAGGSASAYVTEPVSVRSVTKALSGSGTL